MISKKNRLTSIFFLNLFKKGKTIENSVFSLKVITGNQDNFKVAVVVSKKVLKKATERNLLKRRFLSVVSQNKNSFFYKNSYIFYPKKDSISVPYQELEKIILETIKK